MSLNSWSTELSEALGVELDADVSSILDLARDAAHQIERPAAPLTTFLVGYAAGMRGGGELEIADCINIATDLIAAQGQ